MRDTWQCMGQIQMAVPHIHASMHMFRVLQSQRGWWQWPYVYHSISRQGKNVVDKYQESLL